MARGSDDGASLPILDAGSPHSTDVRTDEAARTVTLPAAAALLWSTPAHAWDELGDRVVARIAWDHMTPAARQNAIRLLQAAPPNSGIAELMPQTGTMEERQREWFVWSAVWSDMIRDREHAGARYAHADWHYVNFFWEQRPTAPAAIARTCRAPGS